MLTQSPGSALASFRKGLVGLHSMGLQFSKPVLTQELALSSLWGVVREVGGTSSPNHSTVWLAQFLLHACPWTSNWDQRNSMSCSAWAWVICIYYWTNKWGKEVVGAHPEAGKRAQLHPNYTTTMHGKGEKGKEQMLPKKHGRRSLAGCSNSVPLLIGHTTRSYFLAFTEVKCGHVANGK